MAYMAPTPRTHPTYRRFTGELTPPVREAGYTDKWFGSRRCNDQGSSMSELPCSRQLTLNFRFVVIQEEQTRSWVVGPVEEDTTLIGCLMRSSQRRRSPL